jgi:uncharacterized protein YggE
MKKACLLIILFSPLTLLADGGLPTQPYIYLEGKAEIQKPADMVMIRFNLVVRNSDEVKANQQLQAKANQILELLKGRKISEDDVVAESLMSEPQFQEEENSRNRGKVIGYTITRPFHVKVHDIVAFPKLIDDLIAIGGVEVSGIEGGLAKEKEMQDELWDKALSDARQRAENTLKSMNMKIDSVFAVSPVTFPEIEGRIFGSTTNVPAEGPAEASYAPKASQYRLAPVSLNKSVHVIYLISPVK